MKLNDANRLSDADRRHLMEALLDFEALPGRYPLTLREPRALFDRTRQVLLLAAGRPVEGLTLDPADAPRIQRAACFFVRMAMLRPGADHYTLLGLTPDFQEDALRDHYRLLMRLTHPDFAGPANAWPSDAATRVNQANDLLSSRVQRAEYARQLASTAPRGIPVNGLAAVLPRASRQHRPAAWQWGLAAGGLGALLLTLAQWPSGTGDSDLAQLAQTAPKLSDVAPDSRQTVQTVAAKARASQAAQVAQAEQAAKVKAAQAAQVAQAEQAAKAKAMQAAQVAQAEQAVKAKAMQAAQVAEAEQAAKVKAAQAAQVAQAEQAAKARASQAAQVAQAEQAAKAKAMQAAQVAQAEQAAKAKAMQAAQVAQAEQAAKVKAAQAAQVAQAEQAAKEKAIQAAQVAQAEQAAKIKAAQVAQAARAVQEAQAAQAIQAAKAVVAVAPVAMAVNTYRNPSMADAQPAMGQLIQAMQAGRGEELLRGLDRSIRQSEGATGLVNAYNLLVGDSRAVHLGPVQLRGHAVADQLAVDGIVQLVLHDQGQPPPVRELRLRALFVQRGGQVVMTELSTGGARP